jgi:hypothetical protein
MEIRKSILIIKSNAKGMIGIETFLRNREWTILSTANIREALDYIVKSKPSFVLVPVDHASKKVRTLPQLILQNFQICVIAYAENSNTSGYKLLVESPCEYKINPPVTGPAIERAVNKFIKDQQSLNEVSPTKRESQDNNRNNTGTFVMKGQGAQGPESVNFQTKNDASPDKLAAILNQFNDDETNSGDSIQPLPGATDYGSLKGRVDPKNSNGGAPIFSGPGAAQSHKAGGGPGTEAPLLKAGSGTANEAPLLKAGGNDGSLPADLKEASGATQKSNGGAPILPRPGAAKARKAGGSSGEEAPLLKSGGGESSQSPLLNSLKEDGSLAPEPKAEVEDNRGTQGNSISPENLSPEAPKVDAEVLSTKPAKQGFIPRYDEDESDKKDGSSIQPASELDFKGPSEKPKIVAREISEEEKKAKIHENLNQEVRKVGSSKGWEKNETLIVKGVKKALEDSVQVGDGTVKEKLQDSSNVACIVVESSRFSGYLVAAMGKNRKVDQKLIKMISERLTKFLKDNGEEQVEDAGQGIKIKQVDFEDWALEYAEFLRKSVHNGDEVAMAFFPFAEANHKMGDSASTEMGSIKIDDLHGDIQVEFNLYIFLPANKRYVLYTPKGSKFYGNQKQRLSKMGVTHLHMRKTEAQDLSKYRAQNYLNSKIQEYETRKGKKKSAS